MESVTENRKMTGKAPVFEKIITDYLLQVGLIEAKEEVGKTLKLSARS
jgi:hypothetical protein